MTTISADSLRTLLFCSVKYALGRQTYMPGLVQAIVATHSYALSDQDKLNLAEEIMLEDDVDPKRLGDPDIDRLAWLEFVAWLRKDALGTASNPKADTGEGG